MAGLTHRLQMGWDGAKRRAGAQVGGGEDDGDGLNLTGLVVCFLAAANVVRVAGRFALTGALAA